MRKGILTIVMTVMMMFIALPVNVQASGTPMLGLRWAEYDDATGMYYEVTTNPIESSVSVPMGDSLVTLYFVDENGSESRLVASQVTSSDTSLLTVEHDTRDVEMIHLCYLGVGSASINYTYEGTVYSLPITISLPDIGYYTSAIATPEGYISEYTVTDTENKFYLVCKDGVLNSVSLYESFSEIATVQISSDNTYAEITVSGNPDHGRWYGADVTFTDSYGNACGWEGAGLNLYNGKTSLRFYWAYWNNGVPSMDEYLGTMINTIGGVGDIGIYPCLAGQDGNKQISPDSLTSSDESVITVRTHDTYTDLAIIEVVNVGDAQLIYTDSDGKVYTLKVHVVLPDVGFYTTSAASEETYITEYAVTDGGENKFYVVHRTGTIDTITLDDAFSKIATVQIGDDGTYAEITVNGTTNDSWYGAQVEVSDKWGGTGNYDISIKLINNKSASPVVGFVTRMYQQCLDRNPDQTGLDGWVGQLENGHMNGAQIAEQFVFSNEMLQKNLSNGDFVDVLYRAMMGREADADGRSGWVGQLENGNMSRSEVTKAFVESVEFTEICGSYGITRGTYDASIAPIEKFVTRFYTLCLGRPTPDQSGLYGWVGQLKGQHMNGAEIANSFFFSTEYVNKNTSNDEYVSCLYTTLMGRTADAEGKAGWVSQLQGGYMTRKDVMKAFIESPEFTDICLSYGITRGSL